MQFPILRSLLITINLKSSKKAADITKTAAKLEGLNPVKILSRGYSIAEKDGRAVNSAKMLNSGDEFTLRFSDGEIKAKATGE